MKIAISSTGPDLDCDVDPRFGRCQYFMIVDLDDISFEALPNTNLDQGSGVGIQSAKVVADTGARAVLTGAVGPKAYGVLSDVNIEVITDVSGTVRDAVEKYKNGHFNPVQGPTSESHAGLNSPAQPPGRLPLSGSPGMGRGMGCGRGLGGGRGTGRGMGCGRYGRFPGASDGVVRGKGELSQLKESAQMLQREMREIERRIKELEKEES
jgi:predicted Fe-Mo cluster-binding NifX family protein